MQNSRVILNELQIAKWADVDSNGILSIERGERPYGMCNSDGTGKPLLKLNSFGADIIRFDAGKGVMNHTHEGDHILVVVCGVGFVEYNGIDYPLQPGACYLIPGEVDHAIKAESELIMMAIGNNHQPLDSEARMAPIFK